MLSRPRLRRVNNHTLRNIGSHGVVTSTVYDGGLEGNTVVCDQMSQLLRSFDWLTLHPGQSRRRACVASEVQSRAKMFDPNFTPSPHARPSRPNSDGQTDRLSDHLVWLRGNLYKNLGFKEFFRFLGFLLGF